MKNYVKEFKGYKVPKGATHFTDANETDHAAFWGNFVMWVVDDSGIDKHSSDGIPQEAIELPEAEQEWVPEVGKSCLGLVPVNRIKRDFLEVFVLFHFEGAGIYAVKCKQDSRLYYCKVFKPLKTQEQKEREEFIDKSLNIWNKDCISPSELVEKMFDHGARFTEADK